MSCVSYNSIFSAKSHLDKKPVPDIPGTVLDVNSLTTSSSVYLSWVNFDEVLLFNAMQGKSYRKAESKLSDLYAAPVVNRGITPSDITALGLSLSRDQAAHAGRWPTRWYPTGKPELNALRPLRVLSEVKDCQCLLDSDVSDGRGPRIDPAAQTQLSITKSQMRLSSTRLISKQLLNIDLLNAIRLWKSGSTSLPIRSILINRGPILMFRMIS